MPARAERQVARAAMFEIYAFCRAGRGPAHRAALQRHIATFALGRADLDAVIDGMPVDDGVQLADQARDCFEAAAHVMRRQRRAVRGGSLARVGILLRHAIVQ
jgi:hypothetical protein